MVTYKPHICNIHNCSNSEFKNHMCQEHYDFYMQNPRVNHVVHEIHALETGVASWKLRFKKCLHFIIHHALDLPMPLYEHFALEHVFLSELDTLRRCKDISIDNYKKVKIDFDVPENENIAALVRMLNFRDIESSELGPKGNYILTTLLSFFRQIAINF